MPADRPAYGTHFARCPSGERPRARLDRRAGSHGAPPSRRSAGLAERVCVDHGLTGTHRDRPGLREALAAYRAGDTLVVTKLDRLARSLPAARDIVEDLTRREVKLNLGGSLHDPTDPPDVGVQAGELRTHGLTDSLGGYCRESPQDPTSGVWS